MQIVKLNNVGRKFHKFINTGDLLQEGTGPHHSGNHDGVFWALRNIYLSINEKEIVGFIGRNGSGKSTILNIIAGRLPISEGEVNVNGRVSALLTLGAGFQDEFTGRENIYLNASLLGMSKREIDSKFTDIVGFSELGDFINAPLGSYSAGMKMRLGFSVAIHNEFDILATDEILTVGDVSFQKKCFEKMADFKRQGKSMLIAAQDMGIIERFCDRVFLLEDGKIVSSGVPSEVVERYQMLLNKKKILSEGSRSSMVTKTKRWATDMHEWGTREGTKDVTIDNVIVLDRWGREIDKVKHQDKMIVRVNFTAQEEIDDYHFGVAIFREDGVYAYGPNTQCDGLAIEKMHKGVGYFEIEYRQILLSPGNYYIATAIWDKNETFAYDYHKCNYRIEITGDNSFGQLANLSNKWSSSVGLANLWASTHPNLECLADKLGSQMLDERANIESLICLNNYDYKDTVFVTGRDFKIKTDFSIDNSLAQRLKDLVLWVGIYRSDGVYCSGGFKKIRAIGPNTEVLLYLKLKLLPGDYKISVGVWDLNNNGFITYSHGMHLFNMISERRDHGTVYLEHHWNWKIPRGENR